MILDCEDCAAGHECIGSGTERKCVDIDECNDQRFSADSLAFCGENATCLNYLGSFGCSCNNGYELWAQDVGCSDIDECTNPYWNSNVG